LAQVLSLVIPLPNIGQIDRAGMWLAVRHVTGELKFLD
jgi:hypothetical protein